MMPYAECGAGDARQVRRTAEREHAERAARSVQTVLDEFHGAQNANVRGRAGRRADRVRDRERPRTRATVRQCEQKAERTGRHVRNSGRYCDALTP